MNKRVANKTDVKSSNDKRIYRSIRVIIGIPRCIANSLRSSLVRDVRTEISLSILRLSVMRTDDEESREHRNILIGLFLTRSFNRDYHVCAIRNYHVSDITMES